MAFWLVDRFSDESEGPLELTRRTRALVWDDEVEIVDTMPHPPDVGPLSASPRPSISTMPLPRRARSHSRSSEFPPPIRRRSSEANRPVPFSAKFQKVHPGITGVTVLEHLERLDVVEAGLQRLGVDEPLMEVDEVDVGESSHPRPPALLIRTDGRQEAPQDMSASQQFTPPGSPGGLTSVPEDCSLANSVTEEDLAGMSKSMSHAESPFPFSHTRWKSHVGSTGKQSDRTLDWMNFDENEQRKRTVVVEVGPDQVVIWGINLLILNLQRLEFVEAKPFLNWW